jgi:hypothetical protein
MEIGKEGRLLAFVNEKVGRTAAKVAGGDSEAWRLSVFRLAPFDELASLVELQAQIFSAGRW